MAKLTRKHQKVFAGSATNNGQFGSAQTGTKVTTTDIDTMQSLTAFDNGWNDAVISAQKLPPLEEFQALDHIATRQLAYLFQEGIPEYSASCEYHQNSIVKKTGTYELYGSLINTNTGNALPAAVDNSNWKYLGNLSNLVNTSLGLSNLLYVRHELTSGTGGGIATTSAWTTRPLNTVVNNTISGSSLASNIITLPAGTYYFEASDCQYYASNILLKSRFRNITDSLYYYSQSVSTYSFTAFPMSSGMFTIAGTKTFDLQYYRPNGGASVDLGQPVSIASVNEIYADVKIWKVS